MKAKACVLAIAALLLLTGCSASSKAGTNPSNSKVLYVNLPDGRAVLCVNYNSGLSCDWENAS